TRPCRRAGPGGPCSRRRTWSRRRARWRARSSRCTRRPPSATAWWPCCCDECPASGAARSQLYLPYRFRHLRIEVEQLTQRFRVVIAARRGGEPLDPHGRFVQELVDDPLHGQGHLVL